MDDFLAALEKYEAQEEKDRKAHKRQNGETNERQRKRQKAKAGASREPAKKNGPQKKAATASTTSNQGSELTSNQGSIQSFAQKAKGQPKKLMKEGGVKEKKAEAQSSPQADTGTMSLLERMRRRQVDQDKNPVQDSIYDEQRALGQGVTQPQKDGLEGQMGHRRKHGQRVIEDDDSDVDIVENAQAQRARRQRARNGAPQTVALEDSSSGSPVKGKGPIDESMDFEAIDDESDSESEYMM